MPGKKSGAIGDDLVFNDIRHLHGHPWQQYRAWFYHIDFYAQFTQRFAHFKGDIAHTDNDGFLHCMGFDEGLDLPPVVKGF